LQLLAAMKHIVATLAFLLFSGALPVSPSSGRGQSLALYDDFSADRLDRVAAAVDVRR
jgi:hypothetical protein